MVHVSLADPVENLTNLKSRRPIEDREKWVITYQHFFKQSLWERLCSESGLGVRLVATAIVRPSLSSLPGGQFGGVCLCGRVVRFVWYSH